MLPIFFIFAIKIYQFQLFINQLIECYMSIMESQSIQFYLLLSIIMHLAHQKAEKRNLFLIIHHSIIIKLIKQPLTQSKQMSTFKYDNQVDQNHNEESHHDNQGLQQQSKHQSEPKKKDVQIDHAKKPVPESNRAKLIDQHVKLKNQLKELAEKMDEIVEKQKERKKKKYALNSVEEDERIAELKKQLKEQEGRIQKNKNEINRLRKNLDNKYDINKITEKENELKHLKKQLQNLENEKQALEKIRKTQDKAIRNGEDRETMDKISKMEEQLKQLTHKTKRQVESINEKEKQIRKLHEAYIIKEEKVREIESKAKDKKNNGEDINEYSIAQLEDEIKNLEQERLQIQKQGNERVRALERERKELKNQLDRKKLILDEKEKQLRLNQMKHKEIVRLINSNPQQAQSNTEGAKENKNQGKRVVAKRGREAPKFQSEDVIEDN